MFKNISLRILVFMTTAICCINSYGQKEEPVTLRGRFVNMDKAVTMYDQSEYKYLNPAGANDITILTDDKGNFSISFLLKKPNYYAIQYNKLYLSPGDSMQIVIDGKNQDKAEFSGRGSEANMYLKETLFPAAGSYFVGGREAKNTFQESINYILNQSRLRQKELDTLQGVSKEFKRLEYARIRADVINSLKNWYYALMPLHIKSRDTAMVYKKIYEKLSTPLIREYSKNFVDASLMKLDVYTYIADSLIRQGGNPSDIQQIKDFYTTLDLVDSIRDKNSKRQLPLFKDKIEDKIAKIKTISYRDAANKTLSTLLSFKRGDSASDFIATGITGEAKRLSSYTGEIIYVDFWATWCGPCMAELPYLDTLKEKYKNNKNVVFLSVSVDSDTSKWRNYVKFRQKNNGSFGNQWNVDQNALFKYNVSSIPRAILIDKSFKLINLYAALPSSSDEVNKEIDNALNATIH